MTADAPIAAEDQALATAMAGDIAGAIAIYRRLTAERPNEPDLHYALGHLLLLTGDFSAGWTEHERRSHRAMPFPAWRGEPLGGATILVHGEQGFGDNFQFARYATLVAERGGRVIVGTRLQISRLLSTIRGVERTIVSGDSLEGIARHAPMLSLPAIFGTDLSSIPASVPYISPVPSLVEHWRRRLDGFSGLRVGIVWSGNTEAPYNYRRSPGLAPFLALMDCPGVTFFGMQLGGGHRELQGMVPPSNFVDIAPELVSFDHTAGAMANLDLVISSCTAPAHLAGALARPLWVVLPSLPDWRWFLARDDSPWYPTARLFRQDAPGDWTPVFARMREALAQLAAARRDAPI